MKTEGSLSNVLIREDLLIWSSTGTYIYTVSFRNATLDTVVVTLKIQFTLIHWSTSLVVNWSSLASHVTGDRFRKCYLCYNLQNICYCYIFHNIPNDCHCIA